jgi:polar amino acid transport system substrate-binding protein
MKHTWTTKILAAVGALVALAGCASATGNGAGGQSPAGPASTTIPTPSVDAALAALVPAQYKDATFTYATDATYPPNEYTAADGKTMIGWEIELGNFVAAELGLKAS